MSRYRRWITPVIIILATLTVAAADAAFRRSPDILSYIPADTPFALVSSKPLPDKLADKFDAATDQMLGAYERIIRYAMAERLVALADQDDGAAKAERLRDLVDAITDLMSVEGIRSIGIARDSAFAIYGNGLLPVMRVTLSDTDSFERAVADIERKSGHALRTAELGEIEYRYLELKPFRLVFATLDGQAVVTIVPDTYDESQLAVAVGLEKPRAGIGKSGRLAAMGKEYGLTEHFRGFVDIRRIAHTFLADPTGLNAGLLAVLGYDATSLSDACRSEFAAMAEIAPRVVFGYTRVARNRIDSSLVVELREDLAAGLATLPAAVPGLGADPGGFFAFGLGVNPLSARNFYASRLDAIEKEPYQCDRLADLQGSVVKGREALAQPLPPVVYSFRGFFAHIARVEGLGLASDAPPDSVDASLLLAVENAQDLVTMAAMMDPQIAALNLLPDGKPVRLDMPQLAELAGDAYAALSASGLSVSIGRDAERNAAGMLSARNTAPPPFMSVSMDPGQYYAILGEAMMQDREAGAGKPLPVPIRAALRDAMVSSGSIYDRLSVVVRLTPRGIELTGGVTIKD